MSKFRTRLGIGMVSALPTSTTIQSTTDLSWVCQSWPSLWTHHWWWEQYELAWSQFRRTVSGRGVRILWLPQADWYWSGFALILGSKSTATFSLAGNSTPRFSPLLWTIYQFKPCPFHANMPSPPARKQTHPDAIGSAQFWWKPFKC